MSSRHSSARIEGLDFLRGIAIALVLLRHAFPDQAGKGGIVGVTIFFALSGYLITGILARDLSQYGSIRYWRFYRNRFIRLMPPLVSLLLIYALVTPFWNPQNDQLPIVESLLIGLTYTTNLPLFDPSPVLHHLWTLATEEQFYLVWPLVLALGVKIHNMRLILAVATLAAAFVLIVSIIVAFPDRVADLYSVPTSWGLALIMGSVATLEQSFLLRFYPAPGRVRNGLSILAIVALLALTMTPAAKGSYVTYLVIVPLIAFLTVLLILHLKDWTWITSPWLKPLLWLGTISYAAYLWNYPIIQWLGGYPMEPWKALVSIPFTILAACLSWVFVEKPTAAFRRRLDMPVRPLALSTTISQGAFPQSESSSS